MPTRRQALIAGASATTTALAGCLGILDSPTSPSGDDGPPSEVRNGGFEQGLENWTVGRDLPDDPGNPGTPVDSEVTTTADRSKSGESALSLFVDGSADDGTLWVQQEIDRSAADALEVSVYSNQASFNKLANVAVYTGPEPDGDLTETDFDRSNQAGGHEGWKTFEYPIEGDGPGIVAVGMSVVWETGIRNVFDEVRIA